MAQCDSTPLITASGATIDTINTTALHWCAISYNLHKRYGGFLEFGDVVYLEGFQGKKKIKGKYIVHDLMNPKWTNKIDILKGIGERSVTFDSVKLKHPKIKTFKKIYKAGAFIVDGEKTLIYKREFPSYYGFLTVWSN